MIWNTNNLFLKLNDSFSLTIDYSFSFRKLNHKIFYYFFLFTESFFWFIIETFYLFKLFMQFSMFSWIENFIANLKLGIRFLEFYKGKFCFF